ncbi:MAG: PRC-barrel domain-containing protein [Halioglobus sp.]|nr:PRC-barrel domain-containing protein [Halioglobus sp.]
MHLAASIVIGKEVKNGQGEHLGKIEDLMVDTSTGAIIYAVLSFGGFLGIGEKLFAVPLQAMHVDSEDEQFLLNESKQRLREAPGFDQDDWPDSADPHWCQSVYDYYGI